MSLLEKDKRKFSIIIGSKKCGVCSGTSPSGAAKKVKGKSGAFYLKEMTKDSKKKLYGPYSSKKKVVQRGGEENALREQICNTVLEILRNCDRLREVDEETSNKYKILENAYSLLGIDHRTDKCDVLKDIIRMRDIYITKLGQVFPLCHCLCSSPDIQNPIEIGFCLKHGSYCKSKTKTDKDFYTNNWSKLISFLRRIIRQIELDTRLNVKKTSQKLRGIRNQLNKEENEYFANLRREIEESRAFHAASAGPAQEEPNSNNEKIEQLRQMMNNQKNSALATNILQIPQSMLQAFRRQRNVKPNQSSHNNQNPPNMSNLEARLAALRND